MKHITQSLITDTTDTTYSANATMIPLIHRSCIGLLVGVDRWVRGYFWNGYAFVRKVNCLADTEKCEGNVFSNFVFAKRSIGFS